MTENHYIGVIHYNGVIYYIGVIHYIGPHKPYVLIRNSFFLPILFLTDVSEPRHNMIVLIVSESQLEYSFG
jgi:hypothetical protein